MSKDEQIELLKEMVIGLQMDQEMFERNMDSRWTDAHQVLEDEISKELEDHLNG